MSGNVELEPQELGFKRPFNHEVSQVLRLHNSNSDPVAFKVKTTAPKQYCVRPNSGRIEAGKHVEVQVLLQAMKEDPPLDYRCRDKFLVQSVAVTADKEFSNVSQIWANIEQNAKSSIQEKKIRVNFLAADGEPNGVAGHEEDSVVPSSPTQSVAAVTPQRQSNVPSVGAVSTPESKPDGAKSLGDAKATVQNPEAGTSAIGGAVAAATSALPSSDDLKQQLEKAKAEITRLQAQASEGLRQRKAAASSGGDNGGSSTATSLKNAPATGGVPVQIVAGLCLACFLIAYLFF